MKAILVASMVPSLGLFVYYGLTGNAGLSAFNASVFAGLYLFNFAEYKA